MESFKIFRSSAGSGKTYRLALEYLKLALREPGYYRRILAVTFTNKATNEMKARIITFLFDIAEGRADEKLIETLCLDLGLDYFQLYERARLTLVKLLHGYSYFSVNTIDSFFQRIISAFSRDLGIQGGYQLEFDLGRVKEDLIDRIFLTLDEEKALLNWLVHFSMFKIEANQSWDIRHDIRKLAGELFYERFSMYYGALEEQVKDIRQLSEIQGKISIERKKIRDNLENLGRKGIAFIQNYGLDITDFSRGITGPAGLFQKLVDGQEINLKSSHITKALHSIDAWYTAKSENKEIIARALKEGLQEMFEKAYAEYQSEIIKDNSYREAQKYYYNLGLLAYMMEGLRAYRNENEVILISDLSNLLRVIIGQNDAPFIYEKAGTFYNHFLIDEFQDTSRFQWANFLPLVENSLAAGRFNMVVGDVKQSIYRWRGGDWAILQSKLDEQLKQFPIKHEPLTNNWRSRENIIEFNNNLFKRLPLFLKDKFTEEFQRSPIREEGTDMSFFSSRFEEAYRDVRQTIPEERATKQGGIVEVRFLKEKEEQAGYLNWKEQVLPEVVEKIMDIQDSHYLLKDIVILVRTKEEGRKVANYILDYGKNVQGNSSYRFDVISSESLFLHTSPAVNSIIYFIHLIMDPENIISKANFYYWILMLKSREEDIDFSEILQKISESGSLDEFNRKFMNLEGHVPFSTYRSVPLIDLVEEISFLLDLSAHAEEQAYLLGLHNVVLEYLENNSNDLHSFINWWEEEGGNLSIKPSMEQDAINIMTIHQAKGLEYKMVLVPYCSWSIDHMPSQDNILWASSDLPALDQIPYFPLRYSGKLGESYFTKDYFDEKSMAFMDNLNLLYVTLTRAETGLFIWSEWPKYENRQKTVGDFLFRFLNLYRSKEKERADSELQKILKNWNSEKAIFSYGNMPKQVEVQNDGNRYELASYPKGRWQNRISIRRQTDILSVDEPELAGSKINYGLLFHNVLSKIYKKDQVEYVLMDSESKGEITNEEKKHLQALLEDLWKNETISDWFSSDWIVRTEAPIIPEKGKTLRPDRVMLKGDQAVVVDYKTGTERSADQYQVKQYMDLMKKMGYRKVEGYILYLETVNLIRV